MSMDEKVPLWAVVAAAIAIPILTAGIAWGVGQSRMDAVERQVELLVGKVDQHKAKLGHDPTAISLTEIRSAAELNTEHRHRSESKLRSITRDVTEIKSDVKKLLRRR